MEATALTGRCRRAAGLVAGASAVAAVGRTARGRERDLEPRHVAGRRSDRAGDDPGAWLSVVALIGREVIDYAIKLYQSR
jgi:hypothetical protein